MKTSYDQTTDSLYIHLANRASVDSVEVTDGVVLDYDSQGVVVGVDVQQISQRTSQGDDAVKCVYLDHDDILQIRLSNKPLVREDSPDWRTHISYAEDGSIVALVCLDATGLRQLRA